MNAFLRWPSRCHTKPCKPAPTKRAPVSDKKKEMYIVGHNSFCCPVQLMRKAIGMKSIPMKFNMEPRLAMNRGPYLSTRTNAGKSINIDSV
mmetsp:Transcript_5667/g.10141  ORF Transcript_5667/g.10141 Transcript_5667/m.10141 type:complete len:91 (+) Transcript_5667:146-418(+)